MPLVRHQEGKWTQGSSCTPPDRGELSTPLQRRSPRKIQSSECPKLNPEDEPTRALQRRTPCGFQNSECPNQNPEFTVVDLEAADVLMQAASAEVDLRVQLEELMKIASETDATFG